MFVLLFVAKFDHDRTYFAHVKKCRKCHHPMEKSGGCQHMQCRCGFQFCWECLSAWQDHGPYLTCPTTHIKLTVTAVILFTCSIYCFFNKFYLFYSSFVQTFHFIFCTFKLFISVIKSPCSVKFCTYHSRIISQKIKLI